MRWKASEVMILDQPSPTAAVTEMGVSYEGRLLYFGVFVILIIFESSDFIIKIQ